MIRTAPKYNFKLLKVEVTEFVWVSALKLCRQQTKIFLLEGSWFVLGYFWQREKAQSS